MPRAKPAAQLKDGRAGQTACERLRPPRAVRREPAVRFGLGRDWIEKDCVHPSQSCANPRDGFNAPETGSLRTASTATQSCSSSR